MSAQEIYSPGLEGVIAGETAISTVDVDLSYRGYAVTELAEKVSFEEVAYLLLHEDLPTAGSLDAFAQQVRSSRAIAPTLLDLLRLLPGDAPSMDVLRTAVSTIAHYDAEIADNSHSANLRKAMRLLAKIPTAIACRHRLVRGLEVVAPREDLSEAANFLYMLRGKVPDPAETRAFEVSLILYAEHEFNASTFTARVVCSTEADLHAAVVAAIGALKGRLHGGANEKVMDLLLAAGGPETADKWIRDALARKERVMGFGHRVYKNGDIRAKILKGYARKAAEVTGQLKWEATADAIEAVMEKEKKLLPNLDWPAGRLYHCLGLEIPLFTPIFVMSRITGWSAHVMEQLAHNRLIRPRSRYTGPAPRKVTTLVERG